MSTARIRKEIHKRRPTNSRPPHFLRHVLARNNKIEEDLVDQLFNSSEKRLARVLLLLANYGTDGKAEPLPKISQETLAEIVGTRSRISPDGSRMAITISGPTFSLMMAPRIPGVFHRQCNACAEQETQNHDT